MVSSERPQNVIRSDERKPKDFLDAISSFRVRLLETEFDKGAATSLEGDLKATGLFLLGELHGSRENAEIIYTLFEKFGFSTLGLEWHPSLAPCIDTYLKTGSLDFSALEHSGDGRITAGHFAVLKTLHETGQLQKVVCFDEGDLVGSWDGRDTNMAKNILANIEAGPMLVIAGNLHTNIAPITFDGESHHPMGERVREQIPAAPTGKIRYLRGSFFNFGIEDAGEEPESTSTTPRFFRTNKGYVFELPESHPATVPSPNEPLDD